MAPDLAGARSLPWGEPVAQTPRTGAGWSSCDAPPAPRRCSWSCSTSACSGPWWGARTACTAIGAAEGVSVDLTDVLDPDGGDCWAEVRTDALGASRTDGFAGNDDDGRSGSVETDLGPAPVRVDVVVRSTRGPDGDPATATEVCTACGDVTPELHQPNGAACDGENHAARVRATRDGGFVPLPLRPPS